MALKKVTVSIKFCTEKSNRSNRDKSLSEMTMRCQYNINVMGEIENGRIL